MPETREVPRNNPRTLAAAGLMAAQTVALVAVGVWAGFDGGSARSWSYAATLIALAGCTGALAYFIRLGRAAARTPSVLWNVLLIPLGFTVGDGGAPWAGWVIVGVAIITIVAVVAAPMQREPDDDTDD